MTPPRSDGFTVAALLVTFGHFDSSWLQFFLKHCSVFVFMNTVD